MIKFQGYYSFLSNDGWDYSTNNGIEVTIMAMYYSLTSLSTCGFGDLYPVTDVERVICSFMLLSGVSVFSYVLGELQYMVTNMEALYRDLE